MTSTTRKPKPEPKPTYTRETVLRVKPAPGAGRGAGALFTYDSESDLVSVKVGGATAQVPAEALAGAMGELFRDRKVAQRAFEAWRAADERRRNAESATDSIR